MATTQPEDIPQTIRSRCQHFSFRAVRFEQILGQLRDLTGREKVEADEDALALVAEAGDGSMRDALSILDQAMASSSGRLTAEGVRQLVGAAPSGVLEEVMRAVAQGSSEEVLRLADQLLSEGHNPAHFARQLVRFLRNATVARVAGKDTPLLQISSDERGRVAAIAELFGEEDLARHLQIMLRTYGELGYKQEQRFHLELGLLKMAHAQRLLPIEQLLSDAGWQSSASPAMARNLARPAAVPESRTTVPTARSSSVSPFAADSARKSAPKAEFAAVSDLLEAPRPVGTAVTGASVIMGSAAPVTVAEARTESAPAPLEPATIEAARSPSDAVRNAILNALNTAGQPMLVSMLEAGEWRAEGGEVVVKVAASPTVIEMSLGADAKRIATAAASGILGRPAKLRIVPGGAAPSAPPAAVSPRGNRSRAEHDPIVRRMQEKFGAEIRTIIDQRDKR